MLVNNPDLETLAISPVSRIVVNCGQALAEAPH